MKIRLGHVTHGFAAILIACVKSQNFDPFVTKLTVTFDARRLHLTLGKSTLEV
jgi:hypothetical protein